MSRHVIWIAMSLLKLLALCAAAYGDEGKAAAPDVARKDAKPAAAAPAAADAAKESKESTEATATGVAEEKGRRHLLSAPPIFRLRDSTRIMGYPQIQTVTVDTAYGKLVVPATEVIRIRFAQERDSDLESSV